MNNRLMITKLHIPRRRPDYVERQRLTAQLDEALHLGHRLTLLSAPAGFGKTTLLSAWVAQTGRSAAWLSLDETDNDPQQFLRGCIGALQHLDSAIGQDAEMLLTAPQPPPLLDAAALLINDAAALAPPSILILDDYHLVTSDTVHLAVALLIEHLPHHLHLVISTREDPPLPLARLRAHGQITEIRERDLRFTSEETAQFLTHTMKLTLTPAAVSRLDSRTEGWAVGLQLAAAALRQSGVDAEQFIDSFTGDDRYVVDYLISEVFERQPPEIQAFLSRTAILTRLSAPLCDALTGRTDSQAILDQLEAANLFLISLDRRREWYRYYRLFAEFLSQMLTAQERTALHQQAMRWYEQAGFIEQAVQHALSYAAASGDYAAACRLINTAADQMMQRGGLTTLHSWLDKLPPTAFDAELQVNRGLVAIFSGGSLDVSIDEQAAAALSQQAAGKLSLLQGYVAMSTANYDGVVDSASAALDLLDAKQSHWRVMALWLLAEAQERTRSMALAAESLYTARHTAQELGSTMSAVIIDTSLAAALNEQGKRREAVLILEQALQPHLLVERERPTPMTAVLYTRLSLLRYDANELAAVDALLAHCEAAIGQFALGELEALIYSVRAMLEQAQGSYAAALDRLSRARRLIPAAGLSHPGWINAWEINIRLRQGDLASAARLVEAAHFSPDDTPQYLRIDEHFAYARFLLAQQRWTDLNRWLARLGKFVMGYNLGRRQITASILQALAFNTAGERPAALEHLASAIQLAAPEGYVRAFLDEDATLFTLLPYLRSGAPAFVDSLLNTVRSDKPRHPQQTELIEPLSERELEVLRLIDAGLSNAEIAARLFISQGTVKRHINHIYGKLAVTSRTQALAKSRELGLLNLP